MKPNLPKAFELIKALDAEDAGHDLLQDRTDDEIEFAVGVLLSIEKLESFDSQDAPQRFMGADSVDAPETYCLDGRTYLERRIPFIDGLWSDDPLEFFENVISAAEEEVTKFAASLAKMVAETALRWRMSPGRVATVSNADARLSLSNLEIKLSPHVREMSEEMAKARGEATSYSRSEFLSQLGANGRGIA